MVTIVALGDREVLSIEVNGQRLHPGNVERITTPEPENPYWKIELKDKTVVMATGNVTVQYRGIL
jgi:hypothetical protein